jgi:hypothetical protein
VPFAATGLFYEILLLQLFHHAVEFSSRLLPVVLKFFDNVDRGLRASYASIDRNNDALDLTESKVFRLAVFTAPARFAQFLEARKPPLDWLARKAVAAVPLVVHISDIRKVDGNTRAAIYLKMRLRRIEKRQLLRAKQLLPKTEISDLPAASHHR